MKKAIILSLIFYGYQFIITLLFILINIVRKEPNPTALSVNALGLSVLLSGLMMVGHLIYCRDVKFGWKSFFAVPLRYILLCLPLVLSTMFFLNTVNEMLDLPDFGKATFNMLSRNVFGVLSMVIVAPFVEELLFRGAIEGHFLKQGKSPAFAIVVSSLFFAVVHLNPAQMFFAFLLGLLLGWLYYRTGSVMPGVFCHFINNGMAVLSMILFPDETTMEIVEDTLSLVVILAISLVVFAVSFFYAKKQLPKPL